LFFFFLLYLLLLLLAIGGVLVAPLLGLSLHYIARAGKWRAGGIRKERMEWTGKGTEAFAQLLELLGPGWLGLIS
jgi:hypothetical protein